MLFAIVSLAVVSPTQSSLSRYTRLLLLPFHAACCTSSSARQSLAIRGWPWLRPA
jgi:hypothetical protein